MAVVTDILSASTFLVASHERVGMKPMTIPAIVWGGADQFDAGCSSDSCSRQRHPRG